MILMIKAVRWVGTRGGRNSGRRRRGRGVGRGIAVIKKLKVGEDQ
jgi:hypothetical protein